jgi:hypothetical protein
MLYTEAAMKHIIEFYGSCLGSIQESKGMSQVVL